MAVYPWRLSWQGLILNSYLVYDKKRFNILASSTTLRFQEAEKLREQFHGTVSYAHVIFVEYFETHKSKISEGFTIPSWHEPSPKHETNHLGQSFAGALPVGTMILPNAIRGAPSAVMFTAGLPAAG